MPGEAKGEKQVEKKKWTPLWEQYKDVSEADKIIQTETMSFELLIDDQEDETILRKLEESADYLNKTENLPKMKAFNNYMKERINKAWVQKSDEFAKISAHLYRKYEKAYLEKGESSNWEKLEKEAEKALRGVQERDKASEEIRKNANIMEMEQSIDELLADRKERTDSPAYSGVWNAANDYKKLIKQDPEERAKTSNSEWKAQVVALKNLLSNLEWYASRRYRKHYGTIKGRKRMDRVTKLIALTGSMLEVEPVVTALRDSEEQRDAISQDLRVNYSQELKELEGINGDKLNGRWVDILLPYERNDFGEVTTNTRNNYEDNWETINALKSEDKGLRLTMIAKIYQRFNELQLNEKINEKNYEKVVANSGFYTGLSSLLEMERHRYENNGLEVPAQLVYMEKIVTNAKYLNLVSGTEYYLMSYGFKGADGSVLTDTDEERRVLSQNTAELLMSQAKETKDPDIDEEMERELRERVETLHRDQEYKDKLKQDLQTRDANWQPDVISEEYLADTARCIQKQIIKSKKTQKDLRIHFDEYFNETKLNERGRINPMPCGPGRLRDLMLIYERDAKGNITQETRKNFETNKRLMDLFTSRVGSDRIAAIAYIFLKLKKTHYTKEDVTEKNMIHKFRWEYMTYPLQQSAYNSVMDIINAEVKRTKYKDDLLDYMKIQSDSANMSTMRQLGSGYFGLRGYDCKTGKKVSEKDWEGEKVVNQVIFDGNKNYYEEDAKKEMSKNNGQLIVPDADMEKKLRELCRQKGLE